MSLSDILLNGRTRVEKQDVLRICRKVKDIFSRQPNVLHINSEKLVIVGDLHGQDDDLITILEKNGMDSEYLFLGDYVDRGFEGLRICLLLFSLIAEGRCSIHCLRGNHETKKICYRFGFAEEVRKVYGAKDGKEIFFEFIDVFRMLPIAAVVNEKFFCVHGGIGKSVTTIEEMQKIDRKIPTLTDCPEVSKSPISYYDCDPSILVDLLMSDPYRNGELGFGESKRGSGFYYGEDVTSQFLQQNGLEMIIRSHELAKEGFQYSHNGMVLTVFSCSNYHYKCRNKGAYLIIESKESKTEPEDENVIVDESNNLKIVTYRATRALHDYEKSIDLKGITLNQMGNLQRQIRERRIQKRMRRDHRKKKNLQDAKRIKC